MFKRIKKLTEKVRFAERDKEEATRLAKTIKEENEELKSRLTSLDTGYLNEYGTRLESQLYRLKPHIEMLMKWRCGFYV